MQRPLSEFYPHRVSVAKRVVCARCLQEEAEHLERLIKQAMRPVLGRRRAAHEPGRWLPDAVTERAMQPGSKVKIQPRREGELSVSLISTKTLPRCIVHGVLARTRCPMRHCLLLTMRQGMTYVFTLCHVCAVPAALEVARRHVQDDEYPGSVGLAATHLHPQVCLAVSNLLLLLTQPLGGNPT